MKLIRKFTLSLAFIAGTILFTSCGGGSKATDENTDNTENADVKEEAWNIPLISDADLRKAKKYESIEEALAEPDKVYHLSLREKKLSALPEELFKLKHLQRLDLAFNRDMTSLDPRIGKLKNLQYISLHSCKLTSLPKEIGSLPNLEVLIVESNKLASIPAEIGQLPKIKELKLSYNELSAVPEELYNLASLENLYLHRNDITNLSDKVGQLTNLKNMTLASNQISSVPASIKNLKNLRYLTLSDNKLTALPEELGELNKLSMLYLGKNTGLQKLPESTTKLEKLYDLQLNGCTNLDLEDTFNKLANLPKLQKIWMQKLGKPLKFPKNVKNLASVKALFLDNNEYEQGELSRTFDLISAMPELRTLNISNSKITKIPGNVSKLKNLEYLYMYGNDLTALPAAIGQLTKLKSLSVSSNKNFKTLPPTIGALRNLDRLELSYTAITNLPAAINGMKQLKFIKIRKTNMSQATADQLTKALPDTKIDYAKK
ncbi:leucine-rich repeat domain-containing protein [uncultured Microscilla sp.]|uniref:leucine-rich repeat domain-containing protein n=1 Tax=uncultured Microscilla sp. TaxID=432653 RepID=UPI0026103C42|nr:leucine-rich repeat domain-containing protein [uncultured Microscilla sp.]